MFTRPTAALAVILVMLCASVAHAQNITPPWKWTDIGNVGMPGFGEFDNGTSVFSILDSTSMRIGAGVGLQWISPFGPIRVDYAVPLQQTNFDKTQNFRFSFGTRF